MEIYLKGYCYKLWMEWFRINNMVTKNFSFAFYCNTDFNKELSAWVTIDSDLHKTSDRFQCIYSVDKNQVGQSASVEEKNGLAINIRVPAAGFVIYTKL